MALTELTPNPDEVVFITLKSIEIFKRTDVDHKVFRKSPLNGRQITR